MDEVEQDISGFVPVLGVAEVSPDVVSFVCFGYFSSKDLAIMSSALITSRGLGSDF